MNIPEKLIQKYNVAVPRYTSYPPANFFTETFGEARFREAVIQSNHDQPQNISLYLHIPFCPQLCYYCGCNMHISRDKSLHHRYVKAIQQEIRMLRPLLDPSRKVSQVHWGGGTPNALEIEQVEEIMQLLYHEFDFTVQPEIAIECNPAYLDLAYLDRLHAAGFNRFSLGIQDFSEQVLQTVNRAIPSIPVAELVARIKTYGQAKVNLDFIYGLPHQTPESFAHTIEQAIRLAPDRLVTFSYAHIPQLKKAQQQLEKAGIAGPEAKVKMFENTYRLMSEAGYTAIGLDHFARQDDELSLALTNRKLHRNFQGYCTRETTGQVYAFGNTGISQLENSYAQNVREVKTYLERIAQGKFTTEKGYLLSSQERAVRHVINELMCNHYLSWAEAAATLGVSAEELRQTVRYAPAELEDFSAEGLLLFSDSELTVTPLGRFFVRNIAASFDPNLQQTGKTFSKAL